MESKKEDIRKRQIFGKLERILLSPEGEIYIIITKDKVTEETINFLKSLERRFGNKDIILTFHELIRNVQDNEIEWREE